jgi:hypothetical protein
VTIDDVRVQAPAGVVVPVELGEGLGDGLVDGLDDALGDGLGVPPAPLLLV